MECGNILTTFSVSD